MARVTCSDEARAYLEALPPAVREAVEQRLEYLHHMPRMYAISADDSFPGCRSFWVVPRYRVFYMVAAGGEDVHVLAVREEDVDTTEEGLGAGG